MSKLFGNFNHTVDPKGRANIPARFREVLGEEVTMALSPEGSIMLFSSDEWDKFLGRFSDRPVSEVQEILYYFMGNAHCDNIDKQGRVSIPARLREYANIEKDITIVGLGSKVEIWSTDIWQAKMSALSPDVIRQKMKEANI